MPANPIRTTFKAVIDHQPGTPPKLTVTGEVEVPTTGWTLSLKPAHPQGINPRDLILDLHAVPPHGPAGQIVLHEPVGFTEQPSPEYGEVTIRYEHEAFTIKVHVLV
jgi:hypothetical protein